MKKNILISPVGLKGNEITERIKQLMGTAPINENKSTSHVELTKIGPDGNVYAIVRENHQYFIKTTAKKTNLVSEDFNYIGGLQNKTSEAYSSYAKAIKHLNLKFNSIAESLDTYNNVNVFENDVKGVAFGGMQNGFANNESMEDTEECPIEEEVAVEEDVELTEDEAAIDDMIEEEVEEVEEAEEAKLPVTESHRLSIARSINEMDNLINGITRKKKVYTLK